jgi:hypothetical protein
MFSPWRPFKARSMSTDSHALPNLPEERRLRPLKNAYYSSNTSNHLRIP